MQEPTPGSLLQSAPPRCTIILQYLHDWFFRSKHAIKTRFKKIPHVAQVQHTQASRALPAYSFFTFTMWGSKYLATPNAMKRSTLNNAFSLSSQFTYRLSSESFKLFSLKYACIALLS